LFEAQVAQPDRRRRISAASLRLDTPALQSMPPEAALDRPRGPGRASLLDARTGIVVATALVGKGPWRAAVDETSGRAFVLNRFDNTVSVLDVRRGRVVNTTYAYQPSALVVDTAANRII